MEKGKTTRIIDAAVQELFAGRTYKVVDHEDTPENNKRLMELISKRLAIEHAIGGRVALSGWTGYVLKTNPTKMTMDLKLVQGKDSV